MVEPIEVQISNIGAENFGKLVSFTGMVIATSDVIDIIIEGAWECQKCNRIVVIPQDEEKPVKPKRCTHKGCKGRRFELVDNDCKYINYQKIVVQELYRNIKRNTPAGIEVRLTDDLVNIVTAGDEVILNGVVHHYISSKNNSLVRTRYIRAKSIDVLNRDPDDMEFTDEEIDEFKKLSKHPLIIEKIIKSIAPNIKGRRIIKEGVMLALFGGVSNKIEKKRGNIHIMIIGDPATAKSEILDDVSKIASKGFYAGGKGVSGVGLTAAVLMDKNSGKYLVHCGALVCGNNGIVCIDEIDKMDPKELASVNIAMSQGIVAIAKGGGQWTLSANTTVVAASNPVFEEWDYDKPVNENIGNISKTLLSRFDLTFHAARITDALEIDKISKFKLGIDKDLDPNIEKIDKKLLKKYIAYAKKINPVRNAKANEKIDIYFQDKIMKNDDAITITWRQHDGLQRLTEAYAKIRLSEIANGEDAERAIKIMEESLSQFGTAENINRLDAYKNKRDKETFLLRVIGQLQTGFDSVETKRIYDTMKTYRIEWDETDRMLKILHDKGVILEPKTGFWAIA